jgi:hypothetical protein
MIALAWPLRQARVRWQTWQRMTGRRLTVTGKRRDAELFISLDHARPGSGTLPRRHVPVKGYSDYDQSWQ